MKLWVARDKDNLLFLYWKKPILDEVFEDSWDCPNGKGCFAELDKNEFPEVTFENSPQEVELTLCNHIDTVNIQDWDPKKQTCVMTNHGVTTDVIFK